ncbi:MGT family glycosyltransferase [Bacillus cereus VDM021]|uniref:MGT family glycosyltransferase n=2 Tax=Bacillaceae TaxID=186817 RepID=A0A1Y3MN62_9BACI|nr:MGT family glycosyltransferase [Bacillus cereus VD136]EOP74064.1 MGT family glycosyltransferase [Bacillus cereus VDM006]EOQ11526.1 MGT family glycosyltransferase [Bacillus cereus VDM021]OOG91764.1 hypothetical protein BTH41_01154 [Bacillus mycoides]OUM49870.1 MGT family glycosyltransferase [Bacillus pseudomycoides]
MEMITDSILEEISNETYDYIIYDAQSLPGKWIAHQNKLLSIATWTTFAYSQDPKINMSLTGIDDMEQKQERLTMLKAFLQLEEIAKRKQLKAEQLKNIPDNFIVRNYVPQLDVLRQTDVFISHCGMNSTSESLYFEVPLVMLPIINDQHTIAERVKELGAGAMLNIQQLSAEDIKEAVSEVLRNPIYKNNTKKISQSFRNAGGYSRAANKIFKFTRS